MRRSRQYVEVLTVLSLLSGLAGTQVGHTIANIGSLFGGIFAPHQDTESNDKSSENIAPDVAVDDDNIISLTVSSICSLLDPSSDIEVTKVE